MSSPLGVSQLLAPLPLGLARMQSFQLLVPVGPANTSVISAFGTLWTSEDSVISAPGTCGESEDSVGSAPAALGDLRGLSHSSSPYPWDWVLHIDL